MGGYSSMRSTDWGSGKWSSTVEMKYCSPEWHTHQPAMLTVSLSSASQFWLEASQVTADRVCQSEATNRRLTLQTGVLAKQAPEIFITMLLEKQKRHCVKVNSQTCHLLSKLNPLTRFFNDRWNIIYVYNKSIIGLCRKRGKKVLNQL